MAFNLLVLASNLKAMASNLLAMASNLEAILYGSYNIYTVYNCIDIYIYTHIYVYIYICVLVCTDGNKQVWACNHETDVQYQADNFLHTHHRFGNQLVWRFGDRGSQST